MSTGLVLKTITSLSNETMHYAHAVNEMSMVNNSTINQSTTNVYDNNFLNISYNYSNFAFMIFNSVFFLIHLPYCLCLLSILTCVIENKYWFTFLFVTIAIILIFYIFIFFIEANNQLYIGLFFGFCFIGVIAMDICSCICFLNRMANKR